MFLDSAIKHIDVIKKEHYYESIPVQKQTMNDYPLVTVLVWWADDCFIESFPKFKMLEKEYFSNFSINLMCKPSL